MTRGYDISMCTAVDMDSSNLHQREIIWFLWKENVSVADIVTRLGNVFGEHAMGGSAVYKWVLHYKEGRQSTEDNI